MLPVVVALQGPQRAETAQREGGEESLTQLPGEGPGVESS